MPTNQEPAEDRQKRRTAAHATDDPTKQRDIDRRQIIDELRELIKLVESGDMVAASKLASKIASEVSR